MTPTTVLRVDFREITAMEVTCSNCSGSATIPLPTDAVRRHLECPGCNTVLWGDGQEKIYSYVNALARSISDWKRREHETFRLGFSLTCYPKSM